MKKMYDNSMIRIWYIEYIYKKEGKIYRKSI